MDPMQALQLIHQAAQLAPLPAQAHVQVAQAVQLLQKTLQGYMAAVEGQKPEAQP